jgi:ClpP class serine protease
MTRLHHDSNAIIEGQLTERLRVVEKIVGADALVFVGPIIHPLDDDIREAIEDIPDKQNRLSVVVETFGGYVDSARRIAETLRHHYSHVTFVVPGHAMSAGTILVMSGDAILMDYYSVLGPIDPQIPRTDGDGLVPALGYLVQFERLLEKSKQRQLTDAELAFLLKRFDPGELYQYEQERELSIDLLKEWLVRFKFKDWAVTEGRQLPVTQQMRVDRAEEIAKTLNDTAKWHSHGRGITMPILRDELKLKIGDFGANRELNEAIRGYHRLLKDYMGKMRYEIVVHTRHRFWAAS